MADGNFRFKVNGFDSYTILLGEELRGERATLGKSLLQVQKDLKIKAAYISAIENCDLDAFPNKGFVAGYVRSYARYLNLSPEEVYERFCTESGFTNDNSSVTYGANNYKNKGLKDYKIASQLNWQPSNIGINEIENSIWSRRYLFMGPILLASLFLFGIVFGAWKVLVDIQKLNIVPADNLPIIMSEMNLSSSDIISEKRASSYQLERRTFDIVDRQIPNGNKASPDVVYRDGPIASLDLEDVGVLGLNSLKINKSLPFVGTPNIALENIEFKKFDFGVISEFDGLTTDRKITELAKPSAKTSISWDNGSDDVLLDENTGTLKARNNTYVIKEKVEPTLNIFATNPSWIRIRDEGKKVVVEKILQAGEVLEIKSIWFNGNLRAGNAKDLFFSLDGITYGPVSDKTKVIKNFKIDPQNIFNSLKINDLRDSYLNSLLNNKRSF